MCDAVTRWPWAVTRGEKKFLIRKQGYTDLYYVGEALYKGEISLLCY